VTDRLRALDHLASRGRITPTEYEAGWALIYNALPDPDSKGLASRTR